MKILLLGANGQLGKSIVFTKPRDLELFAFSKKDLNILNKINLKKIILKYQPDWIINASAYTQVDKAEIKKELAFKINKDGPKILAQVINDYGGHLLHISTDFVFDGNNKIPYLPTTKTNPISTYGLSKSLGEQEIKNIFHLSHRGIILRTSWLMGPFGNNFATTIMKLHSEKKIIRVISDQEGAPTSSFSLAKICWKIIKKSKNDSNFKFPLIMHWTDKGVTNWYEIAIEIGKIGLKLNKLQRNAKVIPIKTSEYETKARRPSYSVLDTCETINILNEEPLYWKKSILNSFKIDI